ncbi:fructosamine kinase family protein [Mariprofundus ferrooxydans]|nr:fructosamine kinase family protein [Mariprofundus ferrooxydans]
MFEAEAAGLQALREAAVIRVPELYACACDDRHSWLVMEYITLASHNSVSEKRFAEELASMHACMGESFGWLRDNTIGSTVQINTTNIDWVNFYREQRLGYQLKLANQHGFSTSLQNKGARLMAELHVFFEGYHVRPSLLHGDLWSGNHAVDSDGNPVIFDPAVYYGDREADIAMTELFGGLSGDFYAAYHGAYPLDAGYQVRKELYNLYHILNHANLFGGSYVQQAESMMDQLLVEC